ncbi:CLK4-associating serine/arginine rich protein isoform X2 [Panicum hallii]|uniref:CLK4-associating serine/arginine rich protein isoform X2 n=1 Tax=Panicum hallii TaxID=206008 RepID=UPI000DF4CAFA|nr:CLK4-associating serine/arginine rich protein isoform X2 [Panicum hallii]
MWHEARRSERKVHDLMDAARRRAQRRAAYLARRRGDPQQALQVSGTRCRVYRDDALYQATEDQQGLIPWNGKQDVLIDRFDGRALLDFIRDPSSRPFRVQEKSEEEEELEEFVNFERYRDLIKHRRRGFSDEAGLQHVVQELEAKAVLPFSFEKPQSSQPPASKGAYSQVGYSYKGDGNEEPEDLNSDDDDEEEEDDDDDKDFSSDDSNDERMESIAKEFGVKRYNWLVYMDKKAKEEEKRQKEIIKGDPSIKKLSRRERRKASQIEREKEREAARSVGRVSYRDPYREQRKSPSYEAYSRGRRSRSRSRSRSPSYSRRHGRSIHAESSYRSKPKAPRVEYITEFGGSDDSSEPKVSGISPPSSPIRIDIPNRSSGGQILEALHSDPASSLSVEQERSAKLLKPLPSTSAALAKLSKGASGVTGKTPQTEKKETPQERLKRIMSKQLNKQIRKDTAAEIAKKREQERQRQEKLAEVGRCRRRSRSRSLSRSPPRRRYSRSPSRSRSPRRYHSRSRSSSRSPSRSPSDGAAGTEAGLDTENIPDSQLC